MCLHRKGDGLHQWQEPFIYHSNGGEKKRGKSFFSQPKHHIVSHDSRAICCSLWFVCVSQGSRAIYSYKKNKAAAFLWLLSGRGEKSCLLATQRTIPDRRGKKRCGRNRWDGRDGFKKGEKGESEAKLWLPCSMLYHVAALPSSLKGPELRIRLPTRRWISAFVWAFLPPSLKADFTHAAFNSVRVCCFEVRAVGCFYDKFEFHFAF